MVYHCFFLFERLDSDAPDTYVGNCTLDEFIRLGATLATCLRLSKTKGNVRDYSFFMHSESMAATVRVLKDEAILMCYELYSKDDGSFTIFIRRKDDPSPNSTKAASSEASLHRRMEISGSTLSDILVRPKLKSTSESYDIISGDRVNALAPDEQVILDLGGGKQETYSKHYLLGWIASEFGNGKDLTTIKVHSMGADGRQIEAQLHQHVWETSLLRGPWKQEFQKIWDQYLVVSSNRTIPLSELQKDSRWKDSVIHFLDDLSTFSSNEPSQKRLINTNNAFFLGQPYFDNETVGKILRLPTSQGTLEQYLHNLVQKKKDRGDTLEWCSSHELFPLYERVFNINYKSWKSGIDYKKWKKNRESKVGKDEQEVMRKLTNMSLAETSGGQKSPKK